MEEDDTGNTVSVYAAESTSLPLGHFYNPVKQE